MNRRTVVLLWFAAAGLAVPAAQAGSEGGASSAGQGLVLALQKPIEIECRSKAVVVAENAAAATQGMIRLSLLLKDAAATPKSGSWKVVSSDPAHTGSFARALAITCQEACPLTQPSDDQVQLWAPAPKGVDKLAEKERLTLAVIKTKSLELRASTFEGQAIDALEEAVCSPVS